MNRILVVFAIAASAFAQDGPYKVLKTAKVGGEGRFDYVYADESGRKLYIPRGGNNSGVMGRVTVFNLDTLEAAGEIANTQANGAAVSPKSGHGFASSKPVAMFDAKTLAPIKTITVDGRPDGIMYEASTDSIWVLSHVAPNVTVINAKDGEVLGTIDLGGAPEQGASDGKGRVYIDLEDKGTIAVVDAKARKLVTTYDLAGKGGQCAGLAMDAKNEILFASCRNPQNMVVLNAKGGKIITALPIGQGTDGAQFNPKTMEAFSSQGDGTLSIIKEKSPTEFEVEQNLPTLPGAKTLTFDAKTGHILLIAAQYGPAPAPAADAPKGRGAARGPMLPDSFSVIVVGTK